MNRLDRHDHILIARRKRQRAIDNRPRPWLWAGQGLATILLTLLLIFGVVVGTGFATVLGAIRAFAVPSMAWPRAGILRRAVCSS